MDGIVRIDCAGLSLEAVVAEARRLVGEDDGAEQVLLERVGAAGPLVRSTGEPARLRQWARYHAREAFGVPVVAGETAAEASRPVDLPAEHAGRLSAAAALETFRAPVPVWRAFAEALGAGPVTAEALEEFAERERLLVLDAGGVGFTGAEEHRAVREQLPLTVGQQRAVHRAVLGLREEPVAAGYLHAAWPVHAALAGELGEWIADPGFLVESEWYGLGLGLASAYPEGVPLGGIAGDLHCLLLEGVAAPASHEEWLAWVHHALVSRGLGAAADEVAARVRLPWRTVWSRWQWPSGLAPLADPIPLADEVHLVEREEGGAAFAIRREDEDDWGVEHEWRWDVATGEFLGGPDEDLLEEVEEDDGTGRAAGERGVVVLRRVGAYGVGAAAAVGARCGGRGRAVRAVRCARGHVVGVLRPVRPVRCAGGRGAAGRAAVRAAREARVQRGRPGGVAEPPAAVERGREPGSA
ncbi:hypothetical protein [Kitasatospora sp. NPDC051914]|uniref:hypothetical protein n=1 Tax=Kitasatospora sp. NPDC051914 TaxID=3154945 RepID=UPI0034270831